jgi:hypothetical protein
MIHLVMLVLFGRLYHRLYRFVTIPLTTILITMFIINEAIRKIIIAKRQPQQPLSLVFAESIGLPFT